MCLPNSSAHEISFVNLRLFFTHPHQSCWIITIVSGLLVPSDSHGLFLPMADCCANQRYLSQHGLQGNPEGLDHDFRHASIVTTDRGAQLQSFFFREFIHLLGVKHIKTTAYHPCMNRLVERFH